MRVTDFKVSVSRNVALCITSPMSELLAPLPVSSSSEMFLVSYALEEHRHPFSILLVLLSPPPEKEQWDAHHIFHMCSDPDGDICFQAFLGHLYV